MTERARSRPPLALVVNDHEWAARSLESILGTRGYAVLRASTSGEALERARHGQPDLILLDVGLPDRSGIETCRLLREEARVTSRTPIILTTARTASRSQRLEALAAGAWDLVPLPLDAEELLLRFDAFVRAKVEGDGLADRSLIDRDTDLYNLRGLLRRLHEMSAEAKRSHRSIACIALAPEEWPADSAAGVGLGGGCDDLADFLRSRCRASDAVGRVRACEFAIVALSTDSKGARSLAERLRRVAGGPNGRSGPPCDIRAGYSAETEIREGSFEAEKLLSAATGALRRAQVDPGAGPIAAAEGITA